jgi:hypothetical protein
MGFIGSEMASFDDARVEGSIGDDEQPTIAARRRGIQANLMA